MEHIDFVLWVVLVPIALTLIEFLECKIKIMKGKNIKTDKTPREKKSEDSTNAYIILFYIIIIICLW